MISLWKQWRASKRLQRIVDAKANSFEVEQYRRRPAAALKGVRARG